MKMKLPALERTVYHQHLARVEAISPALLVILPITIIGTFGPWSEYRLDKLRVIILILMSVVQVVVHIFIRMSLERIVLRQRGRVYDVALGSMVPSGVWSSRFWIELHLGFLVAFFFIACLEHHWGWGIIAFGLDLALKGAAYDKFNRAYGGMY